MRRAAWTALIVLVAISALVIVGVVFWPWIAPWLPQEAWLKAWAGYLVTDLHMDRWGLVATLLVVAVVELVWALVLGRTSGAGERRVKALERLHTRETEVLRQEIALLQEERATLKAELDQRNDLVCEERANLWARLEDLQRRSGLTLDRLISLNVPEPPVSVRNQWRPIIARLERIEQVCSSVEGSEANEPLRRQRADGMLRLAAACYRLKQYERALTFCAHAVELVPDDPEPLIDHGVVNLALGRYQAAMGDLDQALMVGEHAWAYLCRGIILERQGEKKRAMDSYGRAIRLDPGFAEAYYRRGLLYVQTEEYDKAVQDQNQVLELDRSHAGAYAARGVVRAALGDSEWALRDLDRACILAPADYQVFYERGQVRYGLGTCNEALADFSRAIELLPSAGHLFLARADTWYALGEYEQAIADYGQAVELQPADARAYYGLGRARAAVEEYQRALEEYGRALELEPGLALALAERGATHEKLGLYTEALNDLNGALALDPALAIAYYYRGLVYGAQGEYDRASRDLNRAAELDPSLRDQTEEPEEVAG